MQLPRHSLFEYLGRVLLMRTGLFACEARMIIKNNNDLEEDQILRNSNAARISRVHIIAVVVQDFTDETDAGREKNDSNQSAVHFFNRDRVQLRNYPATF